VPGVFTLDASVFLNAFNPAEPGHADSAALVAHLQQVVAPIIVPTLLLPEIAGVISRVRGDPDLAQEFSAELARLPNLQLVPLDPVLAHQAAEMAARQNLRGADAVYAAVARRFAAVLVTRDREQRERLSPVITTRSPQEALEEEMRAGG
jgi:predicted nucleic acid-binding protein